MGAAAPRAERLQRAEPRASPVAARRLRVVPPAWAMEQMLLKSLARREAARVSPMVARPQAWPPKAALDEQEPRRHLSFA